MSIKEKVKSTSPLIGELVIGHAAAMPAKPKWG
jgi:hypothetical protein